MPAKKPNILLVTADQLRADALGCYGNTVCRTPNLDRLAAEGVVYENGFTPNPICVPARASITTGNYSHLCTTAKNNAGRIHDDQIKLAAHFATFGYRTYACGKLHYVPYAAPNQPRLLHGFQTWDSAESGRIKRQHDVRNEIRGVEDYHDYLTDVGWKGYTRAHGIGNNDIRPCPTPLPEEHHVDHWVADRTIQRLREHAQAGGDKPFLLWSSFPKPHSPLDPPARFLAGYDPRIIPAPFGDERLLVGRNPLTRVERLARALDSLSPEARQVIKMYYYALITHQDEQIGRIMATLADLGMADNTIILYTADHGDLMGDFGAYFKCSFQDGSVRVPFLVKAPGVAGRRRRRQLVGLQDILPTLANLTDCPLPKAVQGLDFSATLQSNSVPLREVYYSQCNNPPKQLAMLTDGRYKYCYSQKGGVQELYDRQCDPQELVNLASDPAHQSTLRDWRKRLIAEIQRLGDNQLLTPQGDLACQPWDESELQQVPVTGMGWRWY